MRNRLLNFRPTKRSTILVIDEVPREVYGRIVIDESEMEFRPRREEIEPLSNASRPTIETNWDEEIDQYADLWGLDETELNATHTDRYLQTDLSPADLQRRLFYIRQKAEMVLEEQGYTVLFLALGFLEWKESPEASLVRRAPLILVPVQLERRAVGKVYKVSWTNEDMYTNISLQAKLLDQGVKLPDFDMPDDKSGIDAYADDVQKAIVPLKDWRVTSDIYLGFFNFTKFVMYRDLDAQSWPKEQRPSEHALTKAVIAPKEEIPEPGDFADDEQEVAQLSARKLYHVRDADSSQVAVIEAAKVGRNLVVEGPPGTGKSQTIVNMIAELLVTGKTVLFVSQKMAALEVVKDRLDRCGLAAACLELHSRHTRKGVFLSELERTMNLAPPVEISLKNQLRDHEYLTGDLNGYVSALKKPVSPLGRSPYNLYELREKARKHFTDRGVSFTRVRLLQTQEWTEEEYQEAVRKLEWLSVVLANVAPLAEHPWRVCEPERILPDDLDEIRELIVEYKDALDKLRQLLMELDQISAIGELQHIGGAQLALAAARVMAAARPAERSVLLNDEWNQPNTTAEQLLADVALLQDELRTLREVFIPEAFLRDIVALKEELAQADGRWYKFFLPSYWRIRKQVRALYKVRLRINTQQVLAELDRLARFLELRKELAGKEEKGRGLFGHHWRGEDSDVILLRKFARWITGFRRQVIEGYLTERAIDLAETGVDRQQVIEITQQLEQHLNLVIAVRDKLVQRLSLDHGLAFGRSPDEAPFAEWLALLESWSKAMDKLPRWSDWVRLKRQITATVAKPLIPFIEQDKLDARDLVPTLKGNLADALLKSVFEQRPDLADFIAEVHEKKISRFIDLDEEIIKLNRQRLARKLWGMRPQLIGGLSPHSEGGILIGQTKRQRGHMPIRQLMKKVGPLIQKMKPCFMMSPLSIAQFLSPGIIEFDVIIFDEASQVRPEDAIGALLRGKQLIVMGDSHQLPPTSFFDKLVTEDEYSEEDEDEGATGITEVESILKQCERSFQKKTLRWHYRSRHESLIAVSNQEFYENSLLIYPSSVDKSPNLGLEFVHLPDTVYDRGLSATNREEARAVIHASFDHYRQFPDKSLGVGAFSIKQQQAILEELEMQLRLHPEMEEFFISTREEHFFVKNLETIQGDERDVIFISIGYGFDINHKLTKHFGPVNRDGGERRLNVLITRARERCVVFSNFRAQDLSLKEGARPGLRALRTFLDYAENRSLRSIVETGEDTESPFEDAVYEFLRNHGYEIRKQVGCAGFRIDLAVVDPSAPGRYLLAVECDGAKYHSAPVARDRDRLRQRVLENLGWRIHRIWSTDWYRNRAEAQARLLAAIDSAKRDSHEFGKPMSGGATQLRDYPTDCVERQPNSNQQGTAFPLVARIPEYKKCGDLGIEIYGELHQYPPRFMAIAIKRIAEIEGPVHIDEAVNRIRAAWGLRRAGSRIRDAVRWGIEHAERVKFIEVKGSFIWLAGQALAPLRRRTGDPAAKIEYISDEEIAEAVRTILKAQFATERTELATQAARLLGFQAVHSTTSERVQFVMEQLMESNELRLLANGMVDLVT